MMRLTWAIMICVGVAGCEQDRRGEVVEIDGEDLGVDLGVRPDVEVGVPVGDAGPDAMVGPQIATCEGACARRAECGVDDAECLDACRAVTAEERGAWFGCLSAADCDSAGRCRLPAPEGPDCAEICETLEFVCAGSAPGPACLTQCGAARGGFEVCYGELADGVCDVRGFVDCLGRTVYPDCDTACDTLTDCGLEDRADCLTECIAEERPADPIARRRVEARDACRAAAGSSCVALAACEHPGGQPTRQAVCALWSGCDFDWFATCDELYDYGEQWGDGGAALRCAVDMLEQGCPFDPFEVLDRCFQEGGGLRACREICDTAELCDAGAPADWQACRSDCDGIWLADPPDRAAYARRAPQGICQEASDCPSFAACLEQNSPAGICAQHCAALERCDAAPAGCAADCEAAYPLFRHAEYRECVQQAGDCAARDRCALAPEPPCPEYCQRAQMCFGAFDIEACELDCDDAVQQDPAYALSVITCALSAPVCEGDWGEHAVDVCFDEPEQGWRCLGFCEARHQCEGADRAGFVDCLTRCSDGLDADDQLRFAVAEACLFEADATDCDQVLACVPERLEPDCEDLCGRLEGCGMAVEGCPEICGEDPLMRLRAVRAERCLVEAADCPATAACLGLTDVEPAAPPGEPAFCAAWDACGFDRDFDCREAYAILAQEGAEALACGLDELSPCPIDAFWPLDECWGGGVVEDPVCAALCEGRAVCGGEPRAACLEACLGCADADAHARASPLRRCGSALTCPDLAACIEANGPAALCVTHCDAVAACDPEREAEACAEACDAEFPRARQQAWRACVEEAEGCDAVLRCAPAPAPPCADACAVVAGCGFGDPARCAADCDDRAFADPLEGAREVACLLTAHGCDEVQGCIFGDGGGGGLICANYCLAVDDCDPASERPLVTCIEACARGFGGEEALRLERSAECLEAEGEGSGCRSLRACLEEPVLDCPADCATLEACGVPGLEGCLEACDGEQDIERAGCLADARRLGRGCAGVFACAGVEPPPVDPECAGLCAERARCDPALDPLLCALACDAGPAVAIQRACVEVVQCRDIALCLDLDDEIAAPCVAPCGDALECEAFADGGACEALCTGRLRSRAAPADYIARLGPCLRDAAADGCDPAGARACFDVAGGCAAACAAFDACGAPDPDCVEFCELDRRDFPDEIDRAIECALAHVAGGVCDFDEYFFCVDGF